MITDAEIQAMIRVSQPFPKRIETRAELVEMVNVAGLVIPLLESRLQDATEKLERLRNMNDTWKLAHAELAKALKGDY